LHRYRDVAERRRWSRELEDEELLAMEIPHLELPCKDLEAVARQQNKLNLLISPLVLLVDEVAAETKPVLEERCRITYGKWRCELNMLVTVQLDLLVAGAGRRAGERCEAEGQVDRVLPEKQR
jgi:hypothetical protein